MLEHNVSTRQLDDINIYFYFARHSCTKIHQAVRELRTAPQQLERQEKIRVS